MLTRSFPSDAAKDAAMIAILPSVLVLVLSSLFVLQARGRHIAAMLVGGALVAELWTATDGWNPVLAVRGDVSDDAADREVAAAAGRDAAQRAVPHRRHRRGAFSERAGDVRLRRHPHP